MKVNKSKVNKLIRSSDQVIESSGDQEQICHPEFISGSDTDAFKNLHTDVSIAVLERQNDKIPNQVRNDILVGTRSNNQKLKSLDHQAKRDLLITLITARKVAFTLAEVLITLGIIGVVAAMTLPALIQNYQEKATVNKVKKFYSTFSQAYLLAVNDNGTMDNWGLGNSRYEFDEEGNRLGITDETITNIDKFFKIMEPYLIKGGYEALKNSSFDNENKGFQFTDGTSIVGLYLQTNTCARNNKEICGDIYFKADNKPSINENNKKRPNTFNFKLYREHIKPTGFSDADFAKCLNGEDYSRCTAWVIRNENMDYLHCDDLSWNGKTKCK